jgi:hypothetical protein
VEVPDALISGYNETSNVLVIHDKIRNIDEKESSMFPRVREAQLFTYAIASSELRYSAVHERTIFLRSDPDPIVRGEICECGSDCYANLSQVLLEYAISCEGCQDEGKAGELVACTGERLGHILAARLYQNAPNVPVHERVSGALRFILQSMGGEFTEEHQTNQLRYTLTRCPLHDAAQQTGLARSIPIARRGFAALCASLLHTIAPDGVLVEPAPHESGDPLTAVVVKY